MLRRSVVALVCSALAAACAAPPPPPGDADVSRDGGAGSDAPELRPDGAMPGPDGAIPSGDVVVTADGRLAGDGGGPTVLCTSMSTPVLVVTRPMTGSTGPSTTLLRLPLQFRGGATGVRITSVVHRTTGMPAMDVRTWSVADLRAPAGFTGDATPSMGAPDPTVLWTATATSLDAETAPCDRPSYERGGVVHVEGTTDAGGFAVDCALGYGGGVPNALPYACARGVTGWLPTQLGSGGLTTVRMPIVAALASSMVSVHNTGAAPVTGFVATGATVTPRVAGPMPPGVSCPTPAVWEITGGTHTLWRGGSSMDVWSGPAAPGTQVDANWFWELNGTTVPMGLCNVPSVGGDPTRMCPSVVDQFRLRGTSSAGAWEWEGVPFSCYEMPMGG